MKPHLPESTWKKLRLEYQTTKTTCRDLAEKYGINRETVANRCKVEKWRHGDTAAKSRPAPAGNQLVISGDPRQAQQQLFGRVFREANEWLEAIQKLLPQWKTAVEQLKKLFEPELVAPKGPSISVNILSSGLMPPRLIENKGEFGL